MKVNNMMLLSAHASPTFRRAAIAAAVVLLAGCASLSPDSDTAALQQLTTGKTGGVDVKLAVARTGTPGSDVAVTELLKAPLTAQAAVHVALLNNPALQGSMAALGISDAERVQAGRLPNPHFMLGRFRAADTLEIERLLTFNVVGMLSLPWQARWQSQQHELAKLQAAQDVVKLAAETRKAWINAMRRASSPLASAASLTSAM